MKKLIIASITLFVCALVNAQGLFTDKLQKFETRGNKDIVAHAGQVWQKYCGDNPAGEVCKNTLQYDDTAFKAFHSGDQSLALFLLENDFSLKAVNNGTENFLNIMAKTSPNQPKYAETFKRLFAKTSDFSDRELGDFIDEPNPRTQSTVVHLIASATPKNRNLQTAAETSSDSPQKTMLKYLSLDGRVKDSFCKALVWRNNDGNTPFHVAFQDNNKEAFFNLADAAKNAGCDRNQILAALNKVNNNGMSVVKEAFDKAKNSDAFSKNSFYSDVLKQAFSGRQEAFNAAPLPAPDKKVTAALNASLLADTRMMNNVVGDKTQPQATASKTENNSRTAPSAKKVNASADSVKKPVVKKVNPEPVKNIAATKKTNKAIVWERKAPKPVAVKTNIAAVKPAPAKKNTVAAKSSPSVNKAPSNNQSTAQVPQSPERPAAQPSPFFASASKNNTWPMSANPAPAAKPEAKPAKRDVAQAGGKMVFITPIREQYFDRKEARPSSPFGLRRDPTNHARKEFHNGNDFAAKVGTEVRSIQKGTVIFAGVKSGFGNYIEIKHGDSGYVSGYGHLRDFAVKKGQTVAQGDTIGHVGRPQPGEKSTGPHLHLLLKKDGKYIDPNAIPFEEVTLGEVVVMGQAPAAPQEEGYFDKVKSFLKNVF